jgi:hypothetical protein
MREDAATARQPDRAGGRGTGSGTAQRVDRAQSGGCCRQKQQPAFTLANGIDGGVAAAGPAAACRGWRSGAQSIMSVRSVDDAPRDGPTASRVAAGGVVFAVAQTARV